MTARVPSRGRRFMRAPGPRACLHRCNKFHGTCSRHCAGLPQRGTFSRQLCKDRVRLRLLHRHGRAIGLQTQLYRVGGFCCVQRSLRARRFRTPNRLERLVGAIFRSRCTPLRRACPYHAWCVASNSVREGLMVVSGLSSLRHTGGRWRTTETLIHLGRRRGPCRWHRGTGAHWISSAGHFTVAQAHRSMQAWACTQRIVHTP